VADGERIWLQEFDITTARLCHGQDISFAPRRD
jgi:hypothetical protein